MQQPAERVAGLALSQTHLHLLAVVNTELERRRPGSGETVRVLDIGCGDGLLLIFLSKALAACWPGLRFEFHGFDVGDHGVQADGFLAAARERLDAEAPEHDWEQRLRLISEHDAWPYPDGFFDALVSNQVLEHVRDQHLFFDETARVLKRGGFAAHIFPTTHCLVEPHLRVPLAQRVRDGDLLEAWLRLWTRLRVSNERRWSRSRAAASLPGGLDAYARIHTDFLIRLTNFRTQRQLKATAKRSLLAATFRYTPAYYSGKLRSVVGAPSRLSYARRRPFAAQLGNLLLRYVSSSTLVVYR